jgi:glutamate synthase (NADPH/NADH) small chain
MSTVELPVPRNFPNTLEQFPELHPALDSQSALAEANRCLYCFDAPCTTACPTHIDVPRFIKKIATGNLRGSAVTILDANILGLSCSRVCPVDVLCEGSCVMHRYNEQPIEIGRLQRHAMDWFYSHSPSVAPGPDRRKRVACLGAGPASLACSAELRRQGIAVTIFDRNRLGGGLNTYGVAEYKLRPPDSQKEVELIRSMGVEFQLGVDVVEQIQAIESEFDAIFLGIGLGGTHRLNIPGEDLPGVVDALRFIADYKTATRTVGQRVVVIGAGNTAIDAAIAARRLGAEQVHLVYRRGESEMPAFTSEYEHAQLSGIEFHWWTRVTQIAGAAVVEAVECVGPNESKLTIACDMVIPSIGQTRLTDLIARCPGVQMNDGRVVVNRETGQTDSPKYFAGGDCVNGGGEVVDAVAHGKKAAAGIHHMLEASRGRKAHA